MESQSMPVQQGQQEADHETSDIVRTVTMTNKVIIGSAYELKNEATGTTFDLWWCQSKKIEYSYLLLERIQ